MAHAGLVTTSGQVLSDTVLPARGHGMCLSPDGRTAVAFARRPGRFALVIDLVDSERVRQIDSEPGRHFYGHGVFSKDGRWLYATENDFEEGTGKIGIYDAGNRFRRVGEWESHGVEPHEILLMPDGEHLAVANGGILTHPASGREKLNLATMVSSIALLDADDGGLVAAVSPPADLHRLSLRHLAVGPDGRLAVVIQYQGDAMDQVPLLATWDGRAELRFVDDGEAILAAMRNYCGSVAIDASGTVIALTSAPGSLATFWRASDLALIASRHVPDVCGLAASREPGRFLLSSGTGGIWDYDAQTDDLVALAATPRLWDNHMSYITTLSISYNPLKINDL